MSLIIYSYTIFKLYEFFEKKYIIRVKLIVCVAILSLLLFNSMVMQRLSLKISHKKLNSLRTQQNLTHKLHANFMFYFKHANIHVIAKCSTIIIHLNVVKRRDEWRSDELSSYKISHQFSPRYSTLACMLYFVWCHASSSSSLEHSKKKKIKIVPGSFARLSIPLNVVSRAILSNHWFWNHHTELRRSSTTGDTSSIHPSWA